MTKPEALACPVCSNLCSSQAAACPKCGHPISATQAIEFSESSNRNSEMETKPVGLGEGILWLILFASGLYALFAIPIQVGKPYDVGGYSSREIAEANFAIFYHVVPFIIMGMLLAVVYALRGKR